MGDALRNLAILFFLLLGGILVIIVAAIAFSIMQADSTMIATLVGGLLPIIGSWSGAMQTLLGVGVAGFIIYKVVKLSRDKTK